mmetsp:Transcript_4617/g.13733  ORF Transcript_4617/g.13733 Transcript_4617/m.13733 type:complete len:245 (+) Transcript_4617:692-1426(+)
MELVLHEVGDEAQQVPLRHVPTQRLRDRPQDLRQRSPDRLRGVQAQGRKLRQDVLLELLAGQGRLQLQAWLNHPHGLLADLLLVVLHQRHEGLHQGGGRDFGAVRIAELVEVLGDGQPHAPGPVLGGLLDHGHGVLPVLLRVEDPCKHQCGVHGGDADGVLRVLLRELLVDRDDVRHQRPLVADGDEVTYLVRRGAPNHRRLVGAEHGVSLPEPPLLFLRAVFVDRRQQGAGGDTRSEEVRLGC